MRQGTEVLSNLLDRCVRVTHTAQIVIGIGTIYDDLAADLVGILCIAFLRQKKGMDFVNKIWKSECRITSFTENTNRGILIKKDGRRKNGIDKR